MNDFVKITKVNVFEIDNNYAVYLADETNSQLIISVGVSEAYTIMLTLNNESISRPLTHDLLKTIIDFSEIKLDKVIITDLRENTYYALLEIIRKFDNKMLNIDCRPSDGIAIALKTGTDIFVNAQLMTRPEK